MRRKLKEVFVSDWFDYIDRGNYDAQYLSIGARPSFARAAGVDSLRNDFSKTLFLYKNTGSKQNSAAAGLLEFMGQKMLARGDVPWSTLNVERQIIEEADLLDLIEEPELNSPDLAYETDVTISPQAIVNHLRAKASSTAAKLEVTGKALTGAVFDSPREKQFLDHWVTENLGKHFVKWFIPQVPIDLILSSDDDVGDADRRADFMFYAPGKRPLIIELDGEEHEQNKQADNRRDEDLAAFDIQVLRVSNGEVDQGEGPNLSAVKDYCINALDPFDVNPNEGRIVDTIELASWAAKLQYSVLEAAARGSIDISETNKLYIASGLLSPKLVEAAIQDLNTLCRAYVELFSLGEKAFNSFSVSTDAEAANLTIGLYEEETQVTVGGAMSDEDVVICMGHAPIEFGGSFKCDLPRPIMQVADREAVKPLTLFLQSFFRKRGFRDMQAHAICNVLRARDTVTLLPTGAGKSIIYQLSGLLLPGATIVIDPIVALIDDQHLGLQLHGMNRSAPLKADQEKTGNLRRLEDRLAAGQFQYILMSPERLLIQSFRDALSSMQSSTPIHLAVIDEAHCVSQWGHEFRFSYLRLAENLRTLCRNKSDQGPTLLALTGTASRIVLKELVAELDIDINDQESIIRPAHFDREELRFSVIKTDHGGQTFTELSNVLSELPEQLGADESIFFEPNGKQTNSGIVFSPHVNGPTHGLLKIRDNIKNTISRDVGVFASTKPKAFDEGEWQEERARSALSFKDNSSSVLVATKAFGMGIDKPNIRWTLHMGVPSSLEAFYQEAGRAGRDRKPSLCSLIFSEVDQKANDAILDPLIELQDVRSLYKDLQKNRDDVARAMFFHLQSFSSVDDEVDVAGNILDELQGGLQARQVTISYRGRKEDFERAIVRLTQCGLLRDYTTNYSASTFTIISNAFDFDVSANKILGYVRKIQPADINKVRKDLDKFSGSPLEQQPLALCRLIIEFTYRIIETSRRRMLSEAVQMARECQDDQAIRSRLMNYFQEGMYSSQIANLAEQESIDFSDWLGIASEVVDEFDTEEVRGASIRLLEAYPNHAGLLSLRAITEALAVGGSETLVRNSLRAAFASAIERHLCSDEDVSDLIVSLIELSIEKLPGIRNVLVDLLNPTEERVFVPMPYVYERLADASASWDDEARAVALQVITIHSVSDVVPGLRRRVDSFANVAAKVSEGKK